MANGEPALYFDGTDDWLRFDERFDETIHAVFAVIQEDPEALSGRALLGDATTYHFYPQGADIWHTSYTSTLIRSGETRLDGAIVDGTQTPRPKALSVLSVLPAGGVTADRLGRDRN
jgi:hypothetical protein